MDDIVLKSNKDKMGIDWKLAYMELQRITHMMKWDAKQRGIILFSKYLAMKYPIASFCI